MDRFLRGVVPALGRLLLAAIFIQAGLGKIAAPAATIGYIASHGMPLPTVAYVLSMCVELGGGIAILVGFQTRLVAVLMAGFCLVTGYVFHYVPGDVNMMTHLMKNVAIAGGFLQLTAWGPGAWSVDALSTPRSVSAAPASI